MRPLEGVIPVIPVPFHADGSIDETSLRRAVDFTVSRGMTAVCIPAFGSEFYKLTEPEREAVIGIVIAQAAGRISVVAQANHPSSRVAAGLAATYERMGASAISFALPRQFATTDADLLAYSGDIADAVSCPLLIQDFNPGGPTIDAAFIAKAHRMHPNILYVKLEEPMIIDKLAHIRGEVGDSFGVVGGWGGYYMLESVPLGLRGIMPGVPICDLLQMVFRACAKNDADRAYDLFGSILPYIAFTLQNFEMFLQIEKRLMVRRGVFQSTHCRALTRTLSDPVNRHIEYLLDQVFRVLEREGLSVSYEKEAIR